MKKTFTILLCVIVYGLSAWHNYNFISRVYSKGGIAQNEQLGCPMFMITLCPALNTLGVIALHIAEYRISGANSYYNSFFNVKK